MGGRIGLPPAWPKCFPVLMVLINTSSVQAPIPVVESGVRLAGNEIPKGPIKQVRSGQRKIQLPGTSTFLSIGIVGIPPGCPERVLLESGTGPIAVNVLGVWQSPQE